MTFIKPNKRKYQDPKRRTDAEVKSQYPNTTFLTIYTDGSFCPQTKVGGWGVWLRYTKGSQEFSGGIKYAKNAGETEFIAAIQGIEAAVKYIAENGGKYVLVLVTDCQEVQNHINVISHAVTNKNAKEYRHTEHNAVIENLIVALQPSILRVKKVKAHHSEDGARSWANNKVDKLAKDKMRRLRKKAEEAFDE